MRGPRLVHDLSWVDNLPDAQLLAFSLRCSNVLLARNSATVFALPPTSSSAAAAVASGPLSSPSAAHAGQRRPLLATPHQAQAQAQAHGYGDYYGGQYGYDQQSFGYYDGYYASSGSELRF